MLKFTAIEMKDKNKMERYFYQYGEGSCQHSFAASYCLFSKYGDMICEKNNVLYILRSHRCTEKERIYLFPMMDTTCDRKVKEAIEEILDDAHSHGAAVRFETLTAKAKDRLQELFPGRFSAESVRDYAEYIYTYDKLVNLSGGEMAGKRRYFNKFMREYGARTIIEVIRPEHVPEILEFHKYWLETKKCRNLQLEQENEAMHLAFAHYAELGLSGMVIYIDKKLCGYIYGAPLSDTCFDALVGKGDRNVPNIYRVLYREFARLCCQGYEYVNWEEDLGDEGLRNAKMMYKPDILLEKFVVRELEYYE